MGVPDPLRDEREKHQRYVLLSLARLNSITHRMIKVTLNEGLASPALEILKREHELEQEHLSSLLDHGCP